MRSDLDGGTSQSVGDTPQRKRVTKVVRGFPITRSLTRTACNRRSQPCHPVFVRSSCYASWTTYPNTRRRRPWAYRSEPSRALYRVGSPGFVKCW